MRSQKDYAKSAAIYTAVPFPFSLHHNIPQPPTTFSFTFRYIITPNSIKKIVYILGQLKAGSQLRYMKKLVVFFYY